MKNTKAKRGPIAEKIIPFQSLIPQASAQKRLVIDNDPLVFAGPMTDDLIGPDWRFDTVHFNRSWLAAVRNVKPPNHRGIEGITEREWSAWQNLAESRGVDVSELVCDIRTDHLSHVLTAQRCLRKTMS